MNRETKEKIAKKAISLERQGLNDLAWSKQDAELLIKDIMNEKMGILGGDVYKLSSNRLEAVYDNWSCEPDEGESEAEFYLRSKTKSLKYIENYQVQPDENVVFAITFSERVELT